MLKPLADATFRRLFLAQGVALIGTGLATVALGLLAWDLAGDRAGTVLGTALAIKMVAYVTLSPLAAALAARLPRRAFLVGLDLIRAAVVLALPFVDQVWQVYLLIFLLQAASAGFTPAFQAMIPEVLPDARDYTGALSLMRLAEDTEQIASPLLAALLLTMVSFPVLFAGTVAGFVLSALLLGTGTLPPRAAGRTERFWPAATRGLRIVAATPRLRGLLALELAVAAAGAMVYVNTVVLVQARLGLAEAEVALAFAAFGAGSIGGALVVPRLLDRMPDRSVMLAGAVLMVVAVAVLPILGSLATLLAAWALAGFGFSLSQTPVGRVLTRSAAPQDLSAVFAAHFALSHAAWLLTYPLAGWLGAFAGLDAAAVGLALLGALAIVPALRFWPAREPGSLRHDHADLAPDHPHLAEGGGAHQHPFVIDDLHRRWPAAPG